MMPCLMPKESNQLQLEEAVLAQPTLPKTSSAGKAGETGDEDRAHQHPQRVIYSDVDTMP